MPHLHLPPHLEVLALHVGHLHVVGGERELLQLLACNTGASSKTPAQEVDQRSLQLPQPGLTREDIECDHVDLGVAVLPSLGGGHLHDLARTVLKTNSVELSENDEMPTLIMTKPPLRRAEHCMGKVSEAPESPWLKS